MPEYLAATIWAKTAPPAPANALEGVDYRIDLSEKNRKKLAAVLKPYIDAGQKVPNRTRASSRPSARRSTSGAKRDYAKIRQWAKTQGLEVSDRGRVPKRVIEQYDAAH